MGIPADGTNDYGVDVSIKSVIKFGDKYRDEGELFDIQVKATGNWRSLEDGRISVRIEADAYRRLKALLPNRKRLLVVMLLPVEDHEVWMDCAIDRTSLMRALFFIDVDDLNIDLGAQESVTVHFREHNLLNPERLKDFARAVYDRLMRDVGDEA